MFFLNCFRLKLDVFSSDSDWEDDEQPLLYNNDSELPVFSSLTSGYSAEQVAQILMDPKLQPSKVCHVQPMG